MFATNYSDQEPWDVIERKKVRESEKRGKGVNKEKRQKLYVVEIKYLNYHKN